MFLVFTSVYVANAIALCSAIYRLAARLGVSGMGWDDPFYIAAEVFNLILMGGNLSAHIHSGEQQPQSTLFISSSIVSYFMATWTMRAAVFTTFIRYSHVMTERITAHIFFSFLLILIGIMFSTSGTIIYVHSLVHEQGGLQHFPFVFAALAISSDILADTCIIFTTYKFFMTTSFRPIRKLFFVGGLCGPMSAMLITTTSWVLSITIFSFNLRMQICMLNISACYSIAMGCTPAVSAYLYRRYFPNSEETAPEITELDVVFRRPETPNDDLRQDDHQHNVISIPNVTRIPTALVQNHAISHDQCSSLTSIDPKETPTPSSTESKPNFHF